VFPIRDEIPSRRAPLLTWALVAANVAVFVWQAGLGEEGVRQLFFLFGLVPARLSDPGWAAQVGFPPGGALSLVTSMFLHGGLFHLVSNLWTLWIFGDNVEDRMGRFRFLLFYLVCGLAAAFVHWLSAPMSTIPTVGASGAIAGVLGAYLRWYPTAKVLTLVPVFFYPLFVDLPAVLYLGIWFLSQLASGVLSFDPSGGAGGVAWWAHIGGFLAGLLLCGLFAGRERRQLPGPVRHYVLPRAHPRRRPPATGSSR
jgi:membrane associated rhomboid family serine protease